MEPDHPQDKRNTIKMFFARGEQMPALKVMPRGFYPVLVILLLLILSALFLKSLFFGFLAAVLSLPLERFLEHKVLNTKIVHAIHGFFLSLSEPFQRIRKSVMRKAGHKSCDKTEQEIMNARRTSLVMRASMLAVFFPFLIVTVSVWGLWSIAPSISEMTDGSVKWLEKSRVLEKSEAALFRIMDEYIFPDDDTQAQNQGNANAGTTAETPQNADKNSSDIKQEQREKLRIMLADTLAENHINIAKFTLSAGNYLMRDLFGILSWLGGFTFDLLMFAFFYYFFLFKMASFVASHPTVDGTIGDWMVKSIYDSGWLPDVSEQVRKSASQIFNRICEMFNAWLLGYFWIIFIKTILFSLVFIPFHVPFWPVLAFLGGCTTLLPIIGPIVSLAVSMVVAIAFAEGGVMLPVLGIIIGYILIWGILEQLLLYPIMVGEAIGLTLVETIIVVLLGAVCGNIIGMIISVPVAALIKLLIPLFYSSLQNQHKVRRKMEMQTNE